MCFSVWVDFDRWKTEDGGQTNKRMNKRKELSGIKTKSIKRGKKEARDRQQRSSAPPSSFASDLFFFLFSFSFAPAQSSLSFKMGLFGGALAASACLAFSFSAAMHKYSLFFLLLSPSPLQQLASLSSID